MTIEDKIRDEKLKCDINREVAKKTALSLGKNDKYEYFTGKETLPSNQSEMIEKAKVKYLHQEKLLKSKERNKMML